MLAKYRIYVGFPKRVPLPYRNSVKRWRHSLKTFVVKIILMTPAYGTEDFDDALKLNQKFIEASLKKKTAIWTHLDTLSYRLVVVKDL